MRLHKLEISGFGRFSNYSLELGDGLNVIYGPNESGKSTLASFIKSMFYGLKKEGARTRNYQPDYERYFPWLAPSFGGAVEYESGGSSYRIERVFDRNHEKVKVYHLDSGQEITRSFLYDRHRREYVVASKHPGMDEKVFRSSMLLEQSSFVIDSREAAPAIKEKLVNLLMTGDEEVSLRSALRAIERAEGEIGTERSQKKPLGEALSRLELLEKELEGIEAQLESLNSKEVYLASKQRQLEAARDKIERLKKAGLYMEAGDHFHNYLRIQEKLNALKPEETAGELRATRAAFEQCRARTEQQRRDLTELDRQMVVDNPEFWMQKIADLNETILRLNRESALAAKDGAGDNTAGKRKQATVFASFTVTVLIAFLVGVYLRWPLWATGLTVLVSTVLGVLAARSYRKARELGRSDQEAEVRRNVNKLLVMENQNLINDILSQLEAKDIEEAKRVLQASIHLRKRKREIQADIELSQKEILGLESKIQMLEERMVLIQNLKSQKDKEGAVLQSLGFKDVEQSTREFFDFVARYGDYGGDGQRIQDDIQAASREYEEILLEIGKLEQQLNEKERLLERYMELRADISSWQERLQRLKEDLEVLALARKGIEEAVSRYQKDYLSRLNQLTSRVVNTVFGGRYRTVNLTENLEIMTIAPETMKLIRAEQTSRGTVELLYLSLRVALSEILSSSVEDLFLVLDEPFANLDTCRLRQFIAFLEKIAGIRQVIVLTCREEVLKNLPLTANVINLELALAGSPGESLQVPYSGLRR